MKREELVAGVADVVAIELRASVKEVLEVDSLRQRFRMDSIAAANILFAIEEVYSVSFELVESGNVDSVEAIVELLVQALGQPG
jgi:acyl carrier protein